MRSSLVKLVALVFRTLPRGRWPYDIAVALVIGSLLALPVLVPFFKDDRQHQPRTGSIAGVSQIDSGVFLVLCNGNPSETPASLRDRFRSRRPDLDGRFREVQLRDEEGLYGLLMIQNGKDEDPRR